MVEFFLVIVIPQATFSHCHRFCPLPILSSPFGYPILQIYLLLSNTPLTKSANTRTLSNTVIYGTLTIFWSLCLLPAKLKSNEQVRKLAIRQILSIWSCFKAQGLQSFSSSLLTLCRGRLGVLGGLGLRLLGAAFGPQPGVWRHLFLKLRFLDVYHVPNSSASKEPDITDNVV